MSEVAEFYDKFSARQINAGINNRHISILHHLERSGLQRNHNVLEVGCGIGTVSKLILRYLSKKATLTSVDISPVSIDTANKLKESYPNATFEVKDFTKEVLLKQFDVIVLPDVIEHIPFSLYPPFFENLFKMLKDDGFVFIHIPHPNYLEWLVSTESNDLQIIDQPVFTDKFLPYVYRVGFYLHYLKSYSVYLSENDYQIIVLKKRRQLNYQTHGQFFQPKLYNRMINRVRFMLRGFK
jgi:trans-aconitate 2-methyltransferase